MIKFFTDPYENELIYSAAARCMFYEMSNTKEIKNKMFGKKVLFDLELFNGLQFASTYLGKKYALEKIIDDYTTMNFYSPFLSQSKQDDIKRKIEKNQPLEFKFYLRMDQKYNLENMGIYYCPICAQEDIQKYGEPYIHREHQVPGVMVCYEHKVRLLSYGQYTRQECKNNLITIQESKLMKINKSMKKEEVGEKYLLYVKCVIKILSGELKGANLEVVKTKYHKLMFEKGYIDRVGRINRSILYKEFLTFYDTDFLNEMGCTIDDTNSKRCWITQIARPSSQIMNPIKHTLFICFLDPELTEFFSDKGDTKKEVEEYTCDNSFCKYYKQHTHLKSQIIAATNRRYCNPKEMKLITCDCGYSYSYNLLDDERVDEQSRTVREYGWLWEKQLKEYIKNDITRIEQLAKIMGCCSKVIERYIKVWEEGEEMGHLPITYKGDIKVIIRYKKVLRSVVKDHQEYTRTDIYNLCRKEYRKIMAIDPEWINKILPQRTYKSTHDKTNWIEKDQEILEKLKEFYKEYETDEESMQITQLMIAKYLEIDRKTLKRYLTLMPRSNSFYKQIIPT